MQAIKIIVVVAIILATLSLHPWTAFKKVVITSQKSTKCGSVIFFDFIRPLNDSLTYRVKNGYTPGGSVYQNALVNFVWDYETGGFILFTCPRPTGTTCDVYRVEVPYVGNFTSGRNVLSKFQMKKSPRFTFGIEEDGRTYYVCDFENHLLSRFELIPVQNLISFDPNDTICSEDYGNGFNGSDRACSEKFLKNLLLIGDEFDDRTRFLVRSKSWQF